MSPVLSALSAFLLLAATDSLAQTFTPLPVGLGASRLTTLSADGSWAAGTAEGNLLRVNVLTGTIEPFVLPTNASTATATGISRDANTIVVGDGLSAFRFSPATGFEALPTTSPPLQILAPTISDDGRSIGYAQTTLQPFVTQAIVLNNNTTRELPVPTGALYSRASVLSPDGATAFGLIRTEINQDMWLARWSIPDNAFELLAQVPGTTDDTEFLVSDATPDGSVVYGDTFGPDGFGFRWTPADGLFLYDAPVAQRFRPRSTTDDGTYAVGTQRLGPGVFHAVVGDDDSFEPLLDALVRAYPTVENELVGWSLTEATSVSGDGNVIVGFGVDPTGIERGWAFVVPAPAGVAIVTFSLLPLRRQRR